MMRSSLMRHCSALVLCLGFSSFSAVAQQTDDGLPSRQEMWDMIQKQQQQIKNLQSQVGITQKETAKTVTRIAETEKKVEATGAVLDQVAMNRGPAQNPTKVGGYAELHYNGGRADEIDLHRFVVFLSHEFTDKIRFFSELEIEHSIAGDGKVGEVELEQAFVEMDVADDHRVALGLQLIPVGILNETHEPPTFYGVERNNVEKNIIPATWWEAGVKFSGQLAEGVSYDVMMHSGLDTTGKGYKIRSGRQKVGKAPWKNTAVTARLRWQAAPGIEIGGSFQYQDDITQSSMIDESASATLFEVHSIVERAITADSSVALRALYAQWDVNAMAAEILGRDKQRGWYIEPSYKVALDSQNTVGFFARYSQWDNEAGDATDSLYKQTSFGINYWPHRNVVLKVDYQIDSFASEASEASEDNRVNLGVGLQF